VPLQPLPVSLPRQPLPVSLQPLQVCLAPAAGPAHSPHPPLPLEPLPLPHPPLPLPLPLPLPVTLPLPPATAAECHCHSARWAPEVTCGMSRTTIRAWIVFLKKRVHFDPLFNFYFKKSFLCYFIIEIFYLFLLNSIHFWSIFESFTRYLYLNTQFTRDLKIYIIIYPWFKIN
jgi:hypothetical protein